jgi:two-component system, OmpR family, sensor histidine kinase SenX3
VLGNLVGNSIKFTARGEIRVRVEVAPATAGRAEVRWQVTDTGCGIPADALPRVFDAFVQAEPAVTRRFGGTGLGLSIVKHVCANHGGEVRVWSAEGAGSTFTLRLPLHLDPDRSTETPSSPPDVPATHAPPTDTPEGDQ